MASPEQEKSDTPSSPAKTDLIQALADTDRQLELADEIENPLERFFKRDNLLDHRDWLEAEIDASTPPSELT